MDLEALRQRISALATDRCSGASELREEMVEVLSAALTAGLPLEPLARDLLRAQPSMAPAWNLVAHALSSQNAPPRFLRYVEQLQRAPRIAARHLVSLLLTDSETRKIEVVTMSFSGTVLGGLLAAAERRELRVACADGHPALEGRRMAERLAAAGVSVTHYSDAALGQALDGADAVVVGADAVSPEWFLNKTGTRLLASAAAQQGIPFYICTTRDKLLPAAVANRLTIRDEAPDEIWPSPPAGVTVRNRYFETTSLDLVTAVVSDLGVLGAALVPDACTSPHEARLLDLSSDF